MLVPLPLILLLAACASPPAPITFGAPKGAYDLQCVHLEQGERALIGDDLTARASAVTLDSVSLKDVRGMRVLHEYVVRNPGGLSFGVTDVPPPRRTATEIGWSTRADARGAVIPPGTTRNVVLEVQKTTTATGSASAIHLQLTASRTTYGADSGIHYTFPSRCT